MRDDGRLKAAGGAFMGIAITGGWLLSDLLLPEPWGDYLLFSAMAAVHGWAGWRIAQLSEQKKQASASSRTVQAGKRLPYESES